MKRPYFTFIVFLLLLFSVFLQGCNGKGPEPEPSPPQTSATPATPVEDAMIMTKKAEVSLRLAGSTHFTIVLDQDYFESGDTLQVGDGARAYAYCDVISKICNLSSGTYTNCCEPSCSLVVSLEPSPSTYQPTSLVRKASLPQPALLALTKSETEIQQLGLDSATTTLLLSDLYTNWKLEEATDKIDLLQRQLQQPEVQKQMKALYGPMILGTGRLYLKNGQDKKAEESFQLAVQVSQNDHQKGQEAEAHQYLSIIYEKQGAKEEAIHNLEKSRALYKETGRNTEAIEAQEKMRHMETNRLITSVALTQPRELVVPANVLWVDTGITLEKGRHLNIVASGQWSNTGPPSQGPDGFSNYRYPGTILGTANLTSLIAKVGDTMFAVGSTFDGGCPDTGKLYLSINDTPETFADNQGSLQVKISLP